MLPASLGTQGEESLGWATLLFLSHPSSKEFGVVCRGLSLPVLASWGMGEAEQAALGQGHPAHFRAEWGLEPGFPRS